MTPLPGAFTLLVKGYLPAPPPPDLFSVPYLNSTSPLFLSTSNFLERSLYRECNSSTFFALSLSVSFFPRFLFFLFPLFFLVNPAFSPLNSFFVTNRSPVRTLTSDFSGPRLILGPPSFFSPPFFFCSYGSKFSPGGCEHSTFSSRRPFSRPS